MSGSELFNHHGARHTSWIKDAPEASDEFKETLDKLWDKLEDKDDEDI